MNRIDQIRNCLQKFQLIFILSFTGFHLAAQPKIVNKYGLLVIKSTKILQKESKDDPSMKMVNLRQFIPGLHIDLKYATGDNFMHQKLYPPIHTTYLRKPAADALIQVIAELQKQHLTLKVFDAYRPYSITEKMWKAVKDDRYAADPAKGSGHNRGAAVDCTLFDLRTKKELPMGTGFDNFSDTAHSDYDKLPPDIVNNRAILRRVMEKHGFRQLSTEWWHFYLPNSSSFELLDLSFSDLKKMDKR